MYIEGFEQWLKTTRNLSTPLGDWNKVATELCRRIAEEHLEIMEENFSLWSDQLRRLSSVRKPEDLINFQKDCINENVKAGIENIQKIFQISLKNLEDFSKKTSSLHEPLLVKPLEKYKVKFEKHKAKRKPKKSKKHH